MDGGDPGLRRTAQPLDPHKLASRVWSRVVLVPSVPALSRRLQPASRLVPARGRCLGAGAACRSAMRRTPLASQAASPVHHLAKRLQSEPSRM